MSSLFVQPPSGLWAVVKPVQSQILRAIALSVCSAAASVLALTIIPSLFQVLLVETVDLSSVAMRGMGIAIAILLSILWRTWAFRLSHLAAFDLELQLRTELTQHLAQVPLGYPITTGSGAIKKVVQDDVQALHAFVADTTPLIGFACTTPLAALVILLVADWRMTLATLTILPLGLACLFFTTRDQTERRRDYDQANEQINAAVIEFVQGMQVVRLFDDGTSSFARYRRALDTFTQTLKDWIAATDLPGRAGELLFAPLPILWVVTGVGAWFVNQGTLTLPTLLLFLLLAPQISGAFKPILMLSLFINQSQASALSIGEMLAEPILPSPSEVQTPQDASIQLQQVSFAYGDRPALQNISLNCPPGSVTAIVGPSGAGKSTLARLIPRFWEVTEGSICIGGVDIRNMTEAILMSWVAFVFQDTFLIHDTVRANICLGSPTAQEAEIQAAAQAAQAHDFILALPQGYSTLVGERGTSLSGGQRQRITLARALLQDRPIVILDEATAFADPENEALIQRAIATLTQNKTVIIIAHRLSTIKDADQIVVLDQGQIAEQGQHAQLLAREGLYHQLWMAHQRAQHWQLHASQISYA